MDADDSVRSTPQRRYGVGAELHADGVAFRVWAPEAASASVVIEAGPMRANAALTAEADGYFAAFVRELHAGDRYRFRIDDGPLLPDPASRFQPEGPHGASEVVDSRCFAWSDSSWQGVEPGAEVIYEMHVGTFTREGTWEAAAAMLATLAELGVTLIEVMPLAEFPGAFGWGYDGVDLFAPYHGYGRPDALRCFVDAAHALGIGVLIDVVYNHFGPDGNYLRAYTPRWIGSRKSDWGDAPNFDGPQSAPVRAFYADNAAYWIEEFHADGLRFDATQQMLDDSDEHVLHEIVRRARAAAGPRRIFLVAENEAQHAELARRAPAGVGCDAIWNDDFHHAAHVALTGRREAYYGDFRGSAQELLSAVKFGFLYQGQRSAWIRAARGTPALDLRPRAFVHYLESHDQVANSLCGERLHALADPGAIRAATALLLLTPATPMLFQGQEYASSRPFRYFADHGPELAAAVREGRGEFMSQFASIAPAAVRALLPDPGSAATYTSSKLDPNERNSIRGRHAFALCRDLLRLRRDDPVLSGRKRTHLDGATLAGTAFAVRLFGADADDRLLLLNLGPDLDCATVAEPLLAAPAASRWRVLWSSESPQYGGAGDYPFDPAQDGWRLAARSALLLAAAGADAGAMEPA